MHQVLRLRISDLIERGPRTRAEDAGPSAFDVVPPKPPEPEPVTSWWGAVVHRYEATATVTTYGRCSWETTPAGSSLRVEVPALSFPADEPRPGVVALPAWNISAYVAHIPVASVLYYVENTEEWTRDGYANDMDATRGPKWQMFP